jgi:NAD(P)-dependent dehydrogenase (short-subunit alcohol dehydrogenase family)
VIVAITGAGSGIGRALAQEWAARGASLALSDRSEAALAETAGGLPGTVRTRVVDVADPAAIEAWAEAIQADFGAVHVLVNNAGVSLTGPFAEVSAADFEWLFAINWWGVYHGSRIFLPHLARAGTPASPSHLVNLSSIFGVVGVPGQTAYCAAKFAVRGFTEALAAELAGGPVQAHSVHPGGVATRIAEDGRFRVTPDGSVFGDPARAKRLIASGMAPAQAARIIIDGVNAGRERILVGRDAWGLDRLARWFPTGYRRAMRWGARFV